ncbi:MAG: putative cyclase, partial [Solirubrobacterales bacterium]|nr:putative cyclase [Solirubrobacterales bacterium]
LDPDALEAAAAAQRVTLRPADVLLLRTRGTAAPAAAPSLAAWLTAHGIAALALDGAAPDRDLGVPAGGGWSLEALHADCTARGSWDGFLVSVPDGERANAVLFR